MENQTIENLKKELKAQFEFVGSEKISGHTALKIALDCIETVEQQKPKPINLSELSNALRRDFNVSSHSEMKGGYANMIVLVNEEQIKIPVTSEMTYESLKTDLIKELRKNPEFASECEFLIFSLKQSNI